MRLAQCSIDALELSAMQAMEARTLGKAPLHGRRVGMESAGQQQQQQQQQ